MSLKSKLADAKKLWNKAKELKPDFDNVVTDGVYVGKLVKAQVGESESSGRLQVSWSAVISGGEYKGERVNWWSGLKTEQNFMYLQRDLVRLGKETPADINDLEDVLKEIEKEKPAIRFRVKTDGEFQNVRVLKKLNSEEAPEEEAVEEDEAPEDVEVEEEDEPVKGKASKNGHAKVEEEPVEEVEEVAEEEEAALEVGVRVAFDLGDDELVGEVVSVDNDAEKAIVKSDAGKKYKVKIENLRPAPKAKVKKK